jgi:uncharacterized protein involved in exopolysaccharide biosynthesis
LYQQLKQELSQTKTSMEMLSARISEAKHELQGELERGRRVHGGEATLAELTRDYQVNRDIYQDLLRRRENARVSMNLDKEKQGLMIKIQEPAALPLQPSGLRFIHFILIGLVLSVSLPLGVLYLKISLDPRIRVGIAFADKRKLPLLAVVPQLWSSAETQSVRRQVEWISFTIAGTIFVIGLTSVLRFVKII